MTTLLLFLFHLEFKYLVINFSYTNKLEESSNHQSKQLHKVKRGSDILLISI